MPEAIYDTIGIDYARHRRPDPRIAAMLAAAIGAARSAVNVGAGAGSYEPSGIDLVAVEPSAEMVRQRASSGAPVVRAVAEDLPFPDRAFDAAIAILTLHHWRDWRRGLREMRRVARERIVLLTWDPAHPGFWLTEQYFPGILAMDRRIMPPVAAIAEVIGPLEVRPLPIPADCTDGFLGAYWARPESYLDSGARQAISTFSKIPDVDAGLEQLAADLRSGAWQERNGTLLAASELDLGYRVLIA
jgi:SAM-dependent methyltransferase